MIRVGEKLPLDFRVNAVDASGMREVAFGDLLRRRTIVSVHMKNTTPSCDRQVASLAAHAAEFARAGYDVIAVSRDSCGSHRKAAEKHGVEFVLVSDPEDRFAAAANSLVPKVLYGRRYVGPARAAFVLERDGTVAAVIEKVDTADHAAQVRAVIKSL